MKMSDETLPSRETRQKRSVMDALNDSGARYDLLGSVLAKLVIVLWSIVFLFPLYYGAAGSTMSRPEMYSYPPRLLPGSMFVENYTTTLFETGFLRSVVNSLIFAGGSTIGLLMICAPGGYAFAKFDFRGKRTLLVLVLVFMAVPFQLIAIPLFKLAVDFGLMNTFAGAILPAIAAPLGIFFMKQNIEQVIDSNLIRSGRIDGASEFQIFYRIILPLLKPGLLALGVFMFILRMKEFFWPLIILRDGNVQVFQVWISGMRSAHGPEPFEIIFPASVLVTLFLLVIFLAGQKYFIRGLTQGSLKG